MRLTTLILSAILALSVAGCGVRGTLEPPSAAWTVEGAPVAAPVEEDREFILDGLLL